MFQALKRKIAQVMPLFITQALWSTFLDLLPKSLTFAHIELNWCCCCLLQVSLSIQQFNSVAITTTHVVSLYLHSFMAFNITAIILKSCFRIQHIISTANVYLPQETVRLHRDQSCKIVQDWASLAKRCLFVSSMRKRQERWFLLLDEGEF